jgi:Na+/phosphate symporter
MTRLHALWAVIAAIVLFLYGLQSFSRELQTVGGPALRAWLGRVTASPWSGFAVGALAAAIVQSSSEPRVRRCCRAHDPSLTTAL